MDDTDETRHAPDGHVRNHSDEDDNNDVTDNDAPHNYDSADESNGSTAPHDYDSDDIIADSNGGNALHDSDSDEPPSTD